VASTAAAGNLPKMTSEVVEVDHLAVSTRPYPTRAVGSEVATAVVVSAAPRAQTDLKQKMVKAGKE